MNRRLVVLTHLFPGLSPVTVWDVPLSVWRVYAAAVDEWVKNQTK